ncbi:hypothetical protein P691DRAFT_766057 [Macrolepiota fuliginosa MF-IS2]|uniref:Glycan binding protein Y3-like domain-containing protein n=1 Tax=Macrolepiota fuliginosa MF-IS2 TaxID=1400762 RepID=A0A9P5X1B1_9AGAR|nr:hypothetical protein P691DRAFT_766057 [Macrolepiota fuliginosa MF-IS2]
MSYEEGYVHPEHALKCCGPSSVHPEAKFLSSLRVFLVSSHTHSDHDMFKIAFLTSFLAFAVAQIAAQTCYTQGTGPTADCGIFINEFCNSAAQLSVQSRDSQSRCFNLPGGRRCDFIAYNSREISAAPNEPGCQFALHNVARNCPVGGSGRSRANDAYTFTIDPNRGPCTQDAQPSS